MAKNLNKSVVYKTAKPKEKDYTIGDGGGLSLLVKSNGVKRWQFIYRFNGKQNRLGFGIYPDTTLERARLKADVARNNIANGIDPCILNKEAKATRKLAVEESSGNDGITKQLGVEITHCIIEAGLPIKHIYEYKVTIEVTKWQ